jgi:hypothetical protein
MTISESTTRIFQAETAAESLGALLHKLVDYAGIFPPAGLGMQQAVENFASYRHSAHSWMLGRFVVPLSRLGEFENSCVGLSDEETRGEPWRLSVLLGSDVKAEMEKIRWFNERCTAPSSGPSLRIESTESKAASVEEIIRVAELIPSTIESYFEVPLTDELPALVAEIRKVRRRAKIRTGGETAPLFPSCRQISFFLEVCAAERIPFKATAGLHHPVRSMQRFTYKPNSEMGIMHGFLNVFLAAAFVRNGMNAGDAETLLDETSADAFLFDADGISWRGQRLTSQAILSSRQSFCTSFGSCSFLEPITDLQALRLL